MKDNSKLDKNSKKYPSVVLGMTGASGSIYFLRVLESLVQMNYMVHVIPSSRGIQVFEYELEKKFHETMNDMIQEGANIVIEDNNNMFSPVASGSYQTDLMAIVPCSMSTLAEINSGITNSLIARAADVCMKERRKLVLVARETPLSTIHLKNMYELSNQGVTIMPAMPGFYNHPKSLEDSINFVVGKTLDAMKIENNIYQRWEGQNYNEKK